MGFNVRETKAFSVWLGKLNDLRAKTRITFCIDRIAHQGFLSGDFKPVGGGVIELRFTFGPGYRVYVALESGQLLLLLIGGDKSTQSADIKKAQKLLREWRQRDGS